VKRLKILALSLMLGLGLVAVPSPASASTSADSLACTAAGSYSRPPNPITGAPARTYWLVGHGNSWFADYRYWLVETAGTDGTFRHSDQYVAVCNGNTLSNTIDPTWSSDSAHMCAAGSPPPSYPDTVNGNAVTVSFIGEHYSLYWHWFGANYRFWEAGHWVHAGSFWFYAVDQSYVIAC